MIAFAHLVTLPSPNISGIYRLLVAKKVPMIGLDMLANKLGSCSPVCPNGTELSVHKILNLWYWAVWRPLLNIVFPEDFFFPVSNS